MTPEQKAAYVQAQSASALIEAMGMQAENERAAIERGDVPVYGKADFDQLINKYGIHHNATVGLFLER